MAHLLNEKTRQHLEKLILTGVPPLAAAASIGVRPVTMSRWMKLGMREDPPVAPEFPDRMTELHDGSMCAEGVYYSHEKECFKLAQAAMESDAEYVGRLTSFVRDLSLADPATARFMMSKYSHLTGLTEPSVDKPARGSDDSDDKQGDASISFSLPDNGRLAQ